MRCYSFTYSLVLLIRDIFLNRWCIVGIRELGSRVRLVACVTH